MGKVLKRILRVVVISAAVNYVLLVVLIWKYDDQRRLFSTIKLGDSGIAEVILKTYGIFCAADSEVPDKRLCRFNDFWREYRIQFDHGIVVGKDSKPRGILAAMLYARRRPPIKVTGITVISDDGTNRVIEIRGRFGAPVYLAVFNGGKVQIQNANDGQVTVVVPSHSKGELTLLTIAYKSVAVDLP